MPKYDAVLFDLLTALIDSWALWNDVAGSDEDGARWRKHYLVFTYGAGTYRPYEDIVREAAEAADLPPSLASDLHARWNELTPWDDVAETLDAISGAVKMGVVTNCSIPLGRQAAKQTFNGFDVVVTAEEAGAYKPRPEPYLAALKALGTDPARTLFVAGSAADVPGASGVGMPVFWHNRIGLSAVDEVRPQFHERTLATLPGLVLKN